MLFQQDHDWDKRNGLWERSLFEVSYDPGLIPLYFGFFITSFGLFYIFMISPVLRERKKQVAIRKAAEKNEAKDV